MSEVIDEKFIETRGWVERVIKDHKFKDLPALLEYINGKKVLDLGSGGGGFAVDHEAIKSIFPEYTGEIYSLNPRLPNPKHEEEYSNYEIGFTNYKSLDETIKIPNTQEVLKKARKEYEKKAVAGKWEQLPFKDESFDIILATGSYFFYRGTYTPESFKEILRVIKTGGKFHASLYFSRKEYLDDFYEELPDIVSTSGSVKDYEFEILSSKFDERLNRDTFSGYVVFNKL